ncbi:MAG: hypothetical protein COX81_01895 [Candidatus Magasanikbacteria bacterium CG_4_10_14_0_2_um_filter_37_12]|uniref:AAA+ ATPase domain-containing protein n=1 Tax=Candidatus Magasanikbacteria bacterium CG_4_10_14_0_2_um_filter_37_12 TaxID=1974637 RepID=A0A2M7V899_9BACT|nr:MAG: hypothetical protein COX81_01895 [Candidatus Magasanikbacteria bacterium CG_4_10_14_0_2_um_filter_37_12]
MSDDIIGHKSVFEFFGKVIENDNLSHAYCFVGPRGVGKLTVAKEFSARLFEITREKLVATPDFLIVGQEQDEKTGKTKKNISIEQLQGVKNFLTSSAFGKKYKVAIIDEAEKMSIGASNALLKTLEEPSLWTVIFLITTDEDLLPATIRSRCQVVYFYPVNKIEIAEYFVQESFNDELSKEIVKYSQGLPGKAIVWKNDLESFDNYKLERKRFVNLIGKPFYEKLKNVDDLFGDKTDHIVARDKLQDVLFVWQSMLLSESFEINKKELVDIYNQILYTIEMLNKNVHPRLLVEQVLLKLP